PAEPQKVEVFPNGTVMWSGVKIGQLNKPENRATPTTQAKSVPPNPATITETRTVLPIDAEQSALGHIAALEKSHADETAKIAAIQQQKNQINAKILGLSDSRYLDAKDKIDTSIKKAEAEWQALVKLQYRHFDKRDHLRLALESARSALPLARVRAKAQHRVKALAEFADAVYGTRHPQAGSLPVAALLMYLDKSLGEKSVDQIIAAFKATPEPRSPLGFLDFLRGWLKKNTSGNKTLSLEYLNAMAQILQDPARRNLWGVRVSELPAHRQENHRRN
ncbi:MAG: hypothetical protein JKY32_07910, partial [Rhizobiales bacterium]|nr:hypothetical protein [Hyphomicrobiales bacterium]